MCGSMVDIQSTTAEIRRGKKKRNNVIVALPNTGGVLCSTPQSLADAQYWSAVQQRCQDAKPVEICRGAPNYRIDLSRECAEVHDIVGARGDIAA